MLRPLRAMVAIWILAAGAGCSSEEAAGNSSGGGSAGGGAAGAGGSTSTGGAGGGGGAAPPVTVHGVVNDYFPFTTVPPKPIEGVQVCLHDSSIPCTTTDSAGAYSLAGVPGNAEIALLFTKENYASQALAFTTTTEDLTADLRLPNKVVGLLFAEAAGFTLPLVGVGILMGGTGEMVSSDGGTTVAGLPGSKFSISPSAGKGPVYGGTDSPLPDSKATQTGESGAVGWGDLPPGEYTITLLNPAKICTAEGRGWPAGAANSLRTPVIEGFAVQNLWFLCE